VEWRSSRLARHNHFSRNSEGYIVQRISDEDGEPRQWRSFTSWVYTGYGEALELPRDICGSAVWAEEGDVLEDFKDPIETGKFKDWTTGLASSGLPKRIQTGLIGRNKRCAYQFCAVSDGFLRRASMIVFFSTRR
jgi:hypothetical protein